MVCNDFLTKGGRIIEQHHETQTLPWFGYVWGDGKSDNPKLYRGHPVGPWPRSKGGGAATAPHARPRNNPSPPSTGPRHALARHVATPNAHRATTTSPVRPPSAPPPQSPFANPTARRPWTILRFAPSTPRRVPPSTSPPTPRGFASPSPVLCADRHPASAVFLVRSHNVSSLTLAGQSVRPPLAPASTATRCAQPAATLPQPTSSARAVLTAMHRGLLASSDASSNTTSWSFSTPLPRSHRPASLVIERP